MVAGGDWAGDEYKALNPTRSDGRKGSFQSMLKRAFGLILPVGESGGDLIVLYAYLFGLQMAQNQNERDCLLRRCRRWQGWLSNQYYTPRNQNELCVFEPDDLVLSGSHGTRCSEVFMFIDSAGKAYWALFIGLLLWMVAKKSCRAVLRNIL